VPQSRISGRIAIDAPAKINLFLDVTGRRADGYHLLESLVVFVAVGDRLTVEPADTLTLSIEGAFAGALSDLGTNSGTGADIGSDNLILRAARALRDAYSIDAGARMKLEKNLPVSSGIGGGSTDAAAALRVLCALWQVEAGPTRLARIALSLGADIPVCLNARPAMMSGIGEIVNDVAAPPPCGVVLVNAREGVSTPAVFAARKGAFSNTAGWDEPATFERFVDVLRMHNNDLVEAALSVSPVIGEVVHALAASDDCALARLSGSGGTCFGIYRTAAQAAAAAMQIGANHPEWWCVATAIRDGAPEIVWC